MASNYYYNVLTLLATQSHLVDNNEVELLIIASFQTLKRKNEKCGKEDVSWEMKDSIEDAATRETYDELLNKLIHNKSVKLNTTGNSECLSLPNDTQVY